MSEVTHPHRVRRLERELVDLLRRIQEQSNNATFSVNCNQYAGWIERDLHEILEDAGIDTEVN